MITVTISKLATADYTLTTGAALQDQPVMKATTVEHILQFACDILEADVPSDEREVVIIYRPRSRPMYNTSNE